MGNSGCHSRRSDGGVDHDNSLHVGKGSWVRSPGGSSSVGCCAYFSTQRTSGPLLRSFGSVLISPIQADASSVQYASIRFTWVTAGLKIHGRLAYAYDAIYGHVRSGSCPSEFKQQSIRKRILAIQTGLGLSGSFADRKVGPVLNSPRFLHFSNSSNRRIYPCRSPGLARYRFHNILRHPLSTPRIYLLWQGC